MSKRDRDIVAEDSSLKYDHINKSEDKTAFSVMPVDDDKPEKVNDSIKELIKNRTYFINLVIIVLLWVITSFDYFLINF